jgi:hypothetical protein
MNPVRVLFQLLRGVSPVQIPAPGDWQQILDFADRTQLTLYLRGCPRLPLAVERQIEERFARNLVRRQKLQQAFLEIQARMVAAGIQFVVLKGFTHEKGFGLPENQRVQYDLDLLVRPSDLKRAQQTLEDLGYRPHGRKSLSDEHGKPWVRPFEWTWSGDYFDPNMPVAIELHDAVWNQARDRVEGPDEQGLWHRTEEMKIGGICVPALGEADRVAFAALHALRHILRNDAKLSHVWELALLLNSRAEDGAFWAQWRNTCSPELRQLQAVAFRFAEEWFLCRLPQPVAEECTALPAPIAQWFRDFGWSPVENIAGPNKAVVWLHLALVHGLRNRLIVIKERLFPFRLPHQEQGGDYRSRLWDRLRYHATAFLPALCAGVRWWRRTASSTVPHSSD